MNYVVLQHARCGHIAAIGRSHPLIRDKQEAVRDLWGRLGESQWRVRIVDLDDPAAVVGQTCDTCTITVGYMTTEGVSHRSDIEVLRKKLDRWLFDTAGATAVSAPVWHQVNGAAAILAKYAELEAELPATAGDVAVLDQLKAGTKDLGEHAVMLLGVIKVLSPASVREPHILGRGGCR